MAAGGRTVSGVSRMQYGCSRDRAAPALGGTDVTRGPLIRGWSRPRSAGAPRAGELCDSLDASRLSKRVRVEAELGVAFCTLQTPDLTIRSGLSSSAILAGGFVFSLFTPPRGGASVGFEYVSFMRSLIIAFGDNEKFALVCSADTRIWASARPRFERNGSFRTGCRTPLMSD